MIRPEQTVKEVMTRFPATERVFAAHGLDLCCGGTHPIQMAAQAHGVALEPLLVELEQVAEDGVSTVGKVMKLDVRGLEPPEPMVRILSALPGLGPDDVLEVTHFREPVPLYPRLEAAGFSHEIQKEGEALFRLTIKKKV